MHSTFVFFILLIFCYYLRFSKNRLLFIFCFIVSLLLSLSLSLNKILPIFFEIIDGGRIGKNFCNMIFLTCFRYLTYFLSDLYGSSIYKMQYLGGANTNLGNSVKPDNVVEMYLGHASFVYSGIVSILLSIFHIFFF